MLKNKKILLTILMVVLLLLIPNIVKADDENVIEWTNVTMPEIIIGEKPATKENMSIKTNNNLTFEITKVTWEFREENEQGIGGGEMQPNDTFINNANYEVTVEYKIPRGLTYKDGNYFKLNNITRNEMVSGGLITEDDDFFYEFISFNLGKAKAKITYNPDDVCVIAQDIGEVTSALPGKTIRVLSMKEAESWEVTVQGASGACGTVEKADDNGELLYYEFTMPAENVEVTAKYTFKENTETNNTDKEETKKEDIKKEDKKDTSKAPGTIPHAGGTLAIIVSVILLIAGGIYVFRKNNDLKGI